MARGSGSRARGRAAGPRLGDRERGDPQKFKGHALVGVWDAGYLVGLNGNDAASLGELYFRVLSLSQATPANQPLAPAGGAPRYNTQSTIAFTKANGDKLARSNIDTIGIGPSTFLLVGNLRTAGGRVFDNSNSNANGQVLQYSGGVDFTAWGVVGRNVPGGWPIGSVSVLLARDTPGVTASVSTNGTKTTTTSPTATRIAPGASATLSLGSSGGAADYDFCRAAIFGSSLPDSVGGRINKGEGARVGLCIRA
jgi:hypothetical protein